MTTNSLIIVISSVTLSAFAQLMLKVGTSNVPDHSTDNLFHKIFGFISNPIILGGLMLYGVGAIIWLFALKRVDLSLAYPFVGLSFVLTFAFGVFLLNEPFSLNRLFGCTLIVSGVIWLSYS